jgi:dynein heavy chain, axonemal
MCLGFHSHSKFTADGALKSCLHSFKQSAAISPCSIQAKRLLQVLSDTSFLKHLVEFDKDSISDSMLKQMSRVVDDPSFTPDAVAKQSKAAMSMCVWVRAMHTYAEVALVVAPKQAKLQEADAFLETMTAKLHAKQAQLQVRLVKNYQHVPTGMRNMMHSSGCLTSRFNMVTTARDEHSSLQDLVDTVAQLTTQLHETQADLASLQSQANLSEKRLHSAGILTSSLADEGTRWSVIAEERKQDLELVVGHILLASACVSYLGPFSGPYRNDLVQRWLCACKAASLPVAGDFSLTRVLSSDVEVRSWWLQVRCTHSYCRRVCPCLLQQSRCPRELSAQPAHSPRAGSARGQCVN